MPRLPPSSNPNMQAAGNRPCPHRGRSGRETAREVGRSWAIRRLRARAFFCREEVDTEGPPVNTGKRSGQSCRWHVPVCKRERGPRHRDSLARTGAPQPLGALARSRAGDTSPASASYSHSIWRADRVAPAARVVSGPKGSQVTAGFGGGAWICASTSPSNGALTGRPLISSAPPPYSNLATLGGTGDVGT